MLCQQVQALIGRNFHTRRGKWIVIALHAERMISCSWGSMPWSLSSGWQKGQNQCVYYYSSSPVCFSFPRQQQHCLLHWATENVTNPFPLLSLHPESLSHPVLPTAEWWERRSWWKWSVSVSVLLATENRYQAQGCITAWIYAIWNRWFSLSIERNESSSLRYFLTTVSKYWKWTAALGTGVRHH